MLKVFKITFEFQISGRGDYSFLEKRQPERIFFELLLLNIKELSSLPLIQVTSIPWKPI